MKMRSAFYAVFLLLLPLTSVQALSNDIKKQCQIVPVQMSFPDDCVENNTKKQHQTVPTEMSFSGGFVEVAKAASPAVVFIQVETTVSEDEYGGNPFQNELFKRFFGLPEWGGGAPQQHPRVQITQGSGFFISPDGHIITNAHVVERATKIEVTLNSGETIEAKIAGLDPHSDIAVLEIKKDDSISRIDEKSYPFLTFADSNIVEPGEWVVIIGNPLKLQTTVTVGNISAKGRQGLHINRLEDFIQTDAVANRGSSGGPALNIRGEVIGVVTAIACGREGYYVGVTFVVPSEIVKNVSDQVISKGICTRGYLGITLQEITKELAQALHLDRAEGILISEVEAGSAADKAGLQHGDIIVGCNGRRIESLEKFRYTIAMKNPGEKVVIKVDRKGEESREIIVVLGSSETSASGSTEISRRLGIKVKNQEKGEGVVITEVIGGSPAFRKNLRPGLVILSVNLERVSNVEEYNAAIKKAELANESKIILGLKNNAGEVIFKEIDL